MADILYENTYHCQKIERPVFSDLKWSIYGRIVFTSHSSTVFLISDNLKITLDGVCGCRFRRNLENYYKV